jgi:ABC-type nitrate/sulfonate/bicarbonate transport system permease component
MYALIVATGMIGVIINLGMRLIEKRVLAWHSSIRSEVVA